MAGGSYNVGPAYSSLNCIRACVAVDKVQGHMNPCNGIQARSEYRKFHSGVFDLGDSGETTCVSRVVIKKKAKLITQQPTESNQPHTSET